MRPSLFFTTSLSLSPHLLLLHSRIVRGLSSSTTALHSISRSNDGTVIISPKDEAQHSATVVLCHGLGDTANGWVEPTQYLANQLPHVKWILPTAPTQPVTLNMGMAMPSWYDIVGLDSRSSELCNGLDESMERILSLVENEVSGVDSSTTTASACVNPLDYSRIVLSGFSQGGALALYTGMTQLRKQSNVGLGLGGITVMSGYLPRSKAFAIAAGSENTPILHCHGEQDSVVPVQAAAVSKERVSSLLKEMGVGNENNSYEVKTYAGLDHSVSIDELNDVAAFLKRVIPPIARKTDDAQEEEVVVLAAVDPTKMSVRQLKAEIEKRGLKEEARGMLEKSDLVKLLLKNQK